MPSNHPFSRSAVYGHVIVRQRKRGAWVARCFTCDWGMTLSDPLDLASEARTHNLDHAARAAQHTGSALNG